MAVTGTVISAIAAAASTGLAIDNSVKQDKANSKAEAAQEAQMESVKQAGLQAQQQDTVNSQAAQAATLLTQKRAAAAQGVSSTLLTGPLGLPASSSPSPTAQKTLLGQ